MSDEIFEVATIGIDEKKSEMNVLQSVLIISQQRTPKFEFHDTGDKENPPAVVVVNADDVPSVERWHAYHLLHQDKRDISAIMIGKAPLGEAKYFLGRPLIATRLLALLEKVVTEEHGYIAPAAFEETLSGVGNKDAAVGLKENIRALVVDDSLPIRTALKIALQNIATNVDFGETSTDAIQLIQDNDYDIVFLDIILEGDIDGYEVCKLIKQNPRTSKTPVIMLTSNSSPADRVKGKLAGCDTYLIKPVQNAVFEEVVQEYLSAT